MDLKVDISDENGDVLATIKIYQDGSDSVGTNRIRNWIMGHFDTDEEIFILDDQPTTCPHCGSRTEFKEIGDGQQRHTCMTCQFTFTGEFEADKCECGRRAHLCKTFEDPEAEHDDV